jgi:hypothetical protein
MDNGTISPPAGFKDGSWNMTQAFDPSTSSSSPFERTYDFMMANPPTQAPSTTLSPSYSPSSSSSIQPVEVHNTLVGSVVAFWFLMAFFLVCFCWSAKRSPQTEDRNSNISSNHRHRHNNEIREEEEEHQKREMQDSVQEFLRQHFVSRNKVELFGVSDSEESEELHSHDGNPNIDIESGCTSAEIGHDAPYACKNGVHPDGKITDNCAICLETFGCGDSVVGSTNDKCKHIFHQDCVLPFLATSLLQRRKKAREALLSNGSSPVTFSSPPPTSLQSQHETDVETTAGSHFSSVTTAADRPAEQRDSAIAVRNTEIILAMLPCPYCRQPFCQLSALEQDALYTELIAFRRGTRGSTQDDQAPQLMLSWNIYH